MNFCFYFWLIFIEFMFHFLGLIFVWDFSKILRVASCYKIMTREGLPLYTLVVGPFIGSLLNGEAIVHRLPCYNIFLLLCFIFLWYFVWFIRFWSLIVLYVVVVVDSVKWWWNPWWRWQSIVSVVVKVVFNRVAH